MSYNQQHGVSIYLVRVTEVVTVTRFVPVRLYITIMPRTMIDEALLGQSIFRYRDSLNTESSELSFLWCKIIVLVYLGHARYDRRSTHGPRHFPIPRLLKSKIVRIVILVSQK